MALRTSPTASPKALTVLDADMTDAEYSQDGLPHSDWAIYTANDEKIYIVDGMEPVELTSDILGVIDPEASLYVLQFEQAAQ